MMSPTLSPGAANLWLDETRRDAASPQGGKSLGP